MSENTARIAAFAKKLDTAGAKVDRSRATAVRISAEAAKSVLSAAPGAPHTVAKKPVAVKAKVVGDTAYVGWPSVAHLVNDPTKPHIIQRRAYVGTRGRGKKAQRAAAFLSALGVDATNYGGPIAIPGVGPRAYAHHPGTHGKHFFEAGEPAAFEAFRVAYARQFHLQVASVFGGG